MKSILLFFLGYLELIAKAAATIRCADSPLQFYFVDGNGNQLKKNCRWVSKNKNNRCKLNGVETTCPKLCGKCNNVLDAKLEFRVKLNGKFQIKDCAWVKSSYANRCKIKGIADTCRATCFRPKSPLETGQCCVRDSDCISNFCNQQTNVCYETEQCKAIKHNSLTKFDKNHVVLIFVGSGFKNLNDWEKKLKAIYSVFEGYDFFKARVNQFSSFYVYQLRNSFCYFNCAGIERLLCCDIDIAWSITKKCFPPGAMVQTVVVHNSETYGGAGYIGYNVATTSINYAAPLVAVHELGHSLFEFYDEYGYIAVTPSTALNCDADASCPKWNDLINDYPDICTYKGCAGYNYYVSESNSFMKVLNYNVGPVLKRYTCCSFFALTGSVPQYCEEFLKIGMGLYKYCNKSRYNSVNSVVVQVEGIETEKTYITTPGGEKIYISNPVEISFDLKDIEALGNTILNDVPLQTLKPGFYASSLLGEENDESKNMIKFTVTFVSGEIEEVYVSKFNLVTVPPNDDGVEAVYVKKEKINFIFNHDEHGDVASLELESTVA